MSPKLSLTLACLNGRIVVAVQLERDLFRIWGEEKKRIWGEGWKM
jgi:hypothetical protein